MEFCTQNTSIESTIAFLMEHPGHWYYTPLREDSDVFSGVYNMFTLMNISYDIISGKGPRHWLIRVKPAKVIDQGIERTFRLLARVIGSYNTWTDFRVGKHPASVFWGVVTMLTELGIYHVYADFAGELRIRLRADHEIERCEQISERLKKSSNSGQPATFNL